ncbi:MAG TPA: hypothetical protein VGP79_03245 [Bryobacteraceae bacterium]|nr:hypothetical protein [Bryobacteraceae bacterium]
MSTTQPAATAVRWTAWPRKILAGRHSAWLDAALLFVLTALLIKPLFKLDYLDNWSSIEGTFVSDSRFLRDHLPHPGWQPLWYCGTRFDYIYPPAIRYGPALISRYAHVSVARGHHFYTALLYALGIVAVYWLFRAGSGSRGGALLAAAGVALVSPSFLLMKEVRLDSIFWVPQRLHTLMAYGEGPHISAVCILPAVLAAAWKALHRWHPGWFALAGLLAAALVSHNFYGATALAIFFPILVWSVWTAACDHTVWLRAGGIAALAYGLCAVWLTPSYVKITLIDLKWVATPGNKWSRITLAVVVWIFCELSYRFAARRPERTWTVFVAGCGIIVGLWVLAHVHLGFRVSGEHGRLIPELDIVLILVFVEAMRRLWGKKRFRFAAVAFVILFFVPARIYVKNKYTQFPSSGPLEEQYEYGITKWIAENLPGERVFSVGTVRFWYDAWFDNAEQDGGSLQGMLNQNLVLAYWQITADLNPDLPRLWLQALGTDAVVVAGPKSREAFHDMQHPEQFRGRYTPLYDDGQDTIVYRVPRRSTGIGRVIDPRPLDAIGKITAQNSVEKLPQYIAVVEDPKPAAASVTWRGTDAFDVQAEVASGEAILIQETFDPSWRAYENGRPVPIREDPVMNFMILDVPSGSHNIQARFETPLENRIGGVLTASSLMLAVALLIRSRKRRT